MKVTVYNCREDERIYFKKYGEKYKIEVNPLTVAPSEASVYLAEGSDCISITSDSMITPTMLDALKTMGIRFLSTRTIGIEHIDTRYADKIGLGYSNITYRVDGVAEEAVLLMMMVMRNLKTVINRFAGQDYALLPHNGKEFKNSVVGIIGFGETGQALARCLRGFECKILVYTPHPKGKYSDFVEYVSLEELLEKSDIVSLHIPATEENYHFIDADKIEKMKDGAILINTARGSVVDSGALIDALEKKKLGGAGLDVVENDREIYYRDHKDEMIIHHDMAILQWMPNVVLLPHIGFFTENAVSDMVENSLRQCVEYLKK